MAEWYEASQTRRTLELYEQIRAWGQPRGDVTVIGGVAVWELVQPAYRMRSRDIDIVLHSEAALAAFEAGFPDWSIGWRRKGRTTFKDCRFLDSDAYPPIIDVFTTNADIGTRLFTMQRSTNVVPDVKGEPFLPSLPLLLRLKVRAIPQRTGPDAEDKRAKDLLDIYHLVFHNASNDPPLALLTHVPRADRLAAAEHVSAAQRTRPIYAEAYQGLDRWFRAGPSATQQPHRPATGSH